MLYKYFYVILGPIYMFCMVDIMVAQRLEIPSLAVFVRSHANTSKLQKTTNSQHSGHQILYRYSVSIDVRYTYDIKLLQTLWCVFGEHYENTCF